MFRWSTVPALVILAASVLSQGAPGTPLPSVQQLPCVDSYLRGQEGCKLKDLGPGDIGKQYQFTVRKIGKVMPWLSNGPMPVIPLPTEAPSTESTTTESTSTESTTEPPSTESTTMESTSTQLRTTVSTSTESTTTETPSIESTTTESTSTQSTTIESTSTESTTTESTSTESTTETPSTESTTTESTSTESTTTESTSTESTTTESTSTESTTETPSTDSTTTESTSTEPTTTESTSTESTTTESTSTESTTETPSTESTTTESTSTESTTTESTSTESTTTVSTSTTSTTETPSTESTTTESTSTSTSTRPTTTTTTNALPSNPRINQICPTNPGMNDRIRVIALTMHNYRRSRLAQGLVAKNTGRHLPPAANMIRLRYKCSLETSAKAVVDRCSISGSHVPAGVQQNIFSISRSIARYRINAMAEAVKDWWSRVRKDDGIGMKAIYRWHHQFSKISWFTRMAWATTKYLGCAVSQHCDNTWYVACHYSPGGNIVNYRVYEVGKPCTDCPMWYICDSTLLCEAANNF